jgi:hypothetical protein
MYAKRLDRDRHGVESWYIHITVLAAGDHMAEIGLIREKCRCKLKDSTSIHESVS